MKSLYAKFQPSSIQTEGRVKGRQMGTYTDDVVKNLTHIGYYIPLLGSFARVGHKKCPYFHINNNNGNKCFLPLDHLVLMVGWLILQLHCELSVINGEKSNI